MTSLEAEGVPFAFFCSLLREISNIKPRTTAARQKDAKHETRGSYPVLNTFRRWIHKLREQYSPLPPGTTALCFQLLFPDEDTSRKYDIKESRLAKHLSDVLGLPLRNLENWNSEDASGCLGNEVMRLLEPKFSDVDEAQSPFTIARVGELLDELASTTEYSDASIRTKYPPPRRRRTDILKTLFRQLPPQEAALMVQIILKDLRPILYPAPKVNSSASLLDFNTNAVKMLSIEHAMTEWDPSLYMNKLYRVRANLSETATAFEQPDRCKPPFKPEIGSMIRLPKSIKGTGFQNALSYFKSSKTVWAETKYDGERAQIHVEVLEHGSPKIRIFSKSKRDSTWDRLSLHGIIRDTLGFGGPARLRLKKNIVLDAELVAWHEDQIDEFWRIDGLIKQTGSGARARRKSTLKNTEAEDEDYDPYLLTATDESQSSGRHLGLVFFDIIVLDDEPLLFRTYSQRRQLLKTMIKPIPAKAVFSDRYRIDMSESAPIETLQTIFDKHVASHQEGLVLKADESEYNDPYFPWVKLKKDHIKGFGDCIDLMIVAAGWDRDRAQELRVTPNVYTTFWVGAITNTRDVQAKPNTKPHILVYFTVSYGLDRKKLEDFNFRIRCSDNLPFPIATEDHRNLPYTFTISTHLKHHKPQTIIRSPFLVELLCAGFSKSQGSRHYEPRFPRIEKVHRRQERSWTECMDITELNNIARECVGKDKPANDIDDWCRSLWGNPASSSTSTKRQATQQDILTSPDRAKQDLKGPYKRRKVNLNDQTAVNMSSNATSEQHRKKGSDGASRNDHEAQKHPLYDIHNTQTPRQAAISHPELSGSLVSCFIKSNGGHDCHDCLHWKRVMARERRIHSLDSLFIACEGLPSIKRGLVFVHRGDKSMTTNVVRKIEEKRRDFGAQIAVIECDSGNLVI